MLRHYLKEYKIQLSELFFYLFFGSLLFAKGIGLYDGQPWFKFFLLIALVGWGCKQLLTEYTMMDMIGCVILVVFGSVVYFNTHEKGVLFCILLLCSMKGVDLRRTFKVGFVTWLLSFGSLFFLTSLHIIDSSFKVHDKLGLGRIIRWNLGYAHPNVLHISYLVLVCFVVYLLGNQFKLRWFLLLEATNLYVFMYSLSTTGFLAVTFCLVSALYWSFRKKFCKVEMAVIQLCLPFCILLSLVAPVVLKEPFFGFVNKLVNNRLLLSQWFLQNQHGNLLGVDTREIVTSLRTMDNSYVFAYITYGIVFFVLMMGTYFVLIYKKSVKQDGVALCLILSCLIAGITEPFLFNTSFKNISLLFVGDMIWNKKQSKRERALLGKYNRTFSVNILDLKRIFAESMKNARKYRKKLIIITMVAGIVAAAMGFWITPAPKRYIMPRTAFELTNDIPETYYLTSVEDIPQAGDMIMGYVDENTDMVPFAGNITAVERFRNTVTYGIVAMFLLYVASSIFLWEKDIRKQVE